MSFQKKIQFVIDADDNASAKLKGVEKQASLLNKGMKTVGNGAVFAAKSLVALGGALSVAGGFAVKSAAEFEQNRIAFETMLGNAEDAKKMLKDVSDFAAKTPFDLPQVVTGAKSLLAYNIEAEKLLPTFRALGNIAAGVGTDKLPNLILAFGQVRAATRLTGMELRQFTEAGVPLLSMLAEQMGKSEAEIQELVSAGKIGFPEVEKAIFGMSEEGGKFYNLMDRQSKTFSGIISNMKDEIGRVAREIVGINDQGDIKEGGLFYNLKKGAESLLAWMTENKEEITAWVQNFVDQGIEAINKLIKWLQENQETLKATWEAFKLFGKIVLEVIEFVMNVLSLLQKTLETVFYGWFMLIDKAKNYFTKLKDAWSNAIMGMKQIFFSVWDSIKSGLIDGINYFIRKINDLIRAVNKVPGVEIGKIREIGTRAEGGPVSQGSPYIVGERGPEMFVPNQSGTIIPNHQMGTSFNFTFNGDISDKNSLIAEIKQVINRELELSRYGLR